MNRRKSTRAWRCLLLTAALLLNGQTFPANAQERNPIIINFGQPNIWSLEQAHYLLSRMRDRSLDLNTRMPDDDDLDPNTSNGTRLRSVRELLGVGATFDQAAGLQNRLFQENARFGSARRETLLATRDQLQSDLRVATERHSQLVVERSLMNLNGATTAQKEHKDVEVTQAAAVKERLTTDIANTDKELAALNVPAGQLTSPTSPDATTSKLPESVADKLLASDDFKKELRNDPRLNASTVLENHVQMQYEIIAKQLTLLRDEVGPGERLVFLELPHSVYTVPDKANRKLAQVYWHVDGVYAPPTPTSTPTPAPTPCPVATPTASPTPTPGPMPVYPDKYARQERLDRNPYFPDKPRPQEVILREVDEGRYSFRTAEDRIALCRRADPARPQEVLSVPCRRKGESGSQQDEAGTDRFASAFYKSRVRAVDLIPRQSSLNVNDIQDKVKNFNLAGAFNFLFGFGARVDFQRQQRLYEQFLHQDIFASAFGKGTSDFGWTFGPLPGTERVAPGLHTTYAVLVVPADAEVIQLTAKGCYLPRTHYAPNDYYDTSEQNAGTVAASSDGVRCSPQARTFRLVVPGTTENNFWVKAIDYQQVRPGERAVVMVEGEYFSPQMGVLVDGVPLRKAVGVAQVEVLSSHRDDPYVPEPRGEYEFVNSKLLVMAFTMPRDYQGTPNIALVTPGRARIINDLRVVINNSYKLDDNHYKALNVYDPNKPDEPPENPCTDPKESIWVRLKDQQPMFSAVAPKTVLTIADLRVLDVDDGGVVKAYLTGTKFTDAAERAKGNFDEIQINGQPPVDGSVVRRTPELYELRFNPGKLDEWTVAIFQTTKVGSESVTTSATRTFPNPFALNITQEPQILSFDHEATPPVLTVKLVGSGFGPNVTATVVSPGGTTVSFDPISSREAVLTLVSPTPLVTIRLTDTLTRRTRTTIIKRPQPPPKEPRPRYRVYENDATEGARPPGP